MALNFPSSPTIGQVYTDTTSGFSYEWDGTVWKSYAAASSSQIKIIDDISGSFNNSTQTFALTSGSLAISPVTAQSLIVNLGGVVQDPSDDYTVSGSNITFTTAPATGLTFSAVSLGPAVPVDYANNGNVYTRNTFTATAGQTVFTVTGTYTVGYLDVYRNGVRLTSGVDYTATTGTTFTLTTPANLSDEIESIGYKVSLIVTTQGQLDNLVVSGISTLVGQTNASNINASGIVTATNINATGIVTASNINATNINATGIVTASSFVGNGSQLSGVISGVGINTAGGVVGTGVTILDLRGSGISTVTVSSGIATINVSGGGGGGFSAVGYVFGL